MLTIGMLTYSTKPRGSVVCAAALADALTELGHAVTLYALDKDGSGFFRPLKARFEAVPAATLDGPLDQVIARRIEEFGKHLERRGPPHLIYHAQDCLTCNALFTLNDRGFGATVVRTLHHIETFQSAYLDACQRRSVLEADGCISISTTTQNELLSVFGVPSTLIENGVDFQRFSTDQADRGLEVARRFGLNAGGPLLFSVGGVEPRKNSLAQLAAFRQVRQKYPRALWVIAGGATALDHKAYEERFLRQLARMSKEEQRSVVRANVVSDEELAALYKICDVFVHPALKEGFGLSVVEALASGARVVVSEGQPFDEYLLPSDAIRVNPKSPSSIASGILSALRTSARASVSLGRLKARFDRQRAAGEHIAFYRRLLESGGRERSGMVARQPPEEAQPCQK